MQNVILGERHWNHEEEHEIIKFDQGSLGKNHKSSIIENITIILKNKMDALNQRWDIGELIN